LHFFILELQYSKVYRTFLNTDTVCKWGEKALSGSPFSAFNRILGLTTQLTTTGIVLYGNNGNNVQNGAF